MGENPEGIEYADQRDWYFFVHNVYANFFKDSLDYFAGHVWPRFEHRVVATYDKAVEYLVKKCQYDGREVDLPMLPAMILNPSGEFNLAEAIAGGKQTWRFPNLSPGFGKRLFIPIYQDENMYITVVFMRIEGDIELLMLLNSFYEYCDLRMLFLNVFAGFDRWIYPQYFTSFIILPPELLNYKYENDITGVDYTPDWDEIGAYEHLVRTTARNEMVYPVNIKPIYKLTGFSDVSQRYGGTDKLADWRLGATIKYEVEIPTYVVVTQDYLARNLNAEIKAGSAYTVYDPLQVPEYRNLWDKSRDCIVPDGTSTIEVDCTASVDCSQQECDFKVRYFHVVTQGEAESTTNIEFRLPEQILDHNLLLINSKYGLLTYGDHWRLSNDGWYVTILVENVELEEGMILELYVYRNRIGDIT
jgi:hypothetical protein